MGMDNYLISGIQQIGVGTVDLHKSWNWYIDMFGIDIRILEDDTVAERMLPYTGHQPQKRHACIAVSLQGGAGFEIWQYSERKPVTCDFEIKAGDLGIFAARLKCRDIDAFHKEISYKWEKVGKPGRLPDGTKCLYVKDLYDNIFQIVEDRSIFIEQHRLTGGITGAVIGVTDIDRSLAVYRDLLGYDRVIYDRTGVFSDWAFIPGSEQKYRRILLGCSAKRSGAFSGLYGESTIELVQALNRTPSRIYEGRYWGDPGFIQVCFDVTGMKVFGEECRRRGFPFTVDSCPSDEVFDMGDASGHFTYIEDPDGTLIEFVETRKIPVVKKWNWFIDLTGRRPGRKLPRFLFRMMGKVSRVKCTRV